jgi:isopenicillin N synthase-like dioxygenase
MLVQKIRIACLETGFFYIHNTCVEDKVIQNILSAMEIFHLLDDSSVKIDIHKEHVKSIKGWALIFGERPIRRIRSLI